MKSKIKTRAFRALIVTAFALLLVLGSAPGKTKQVTIADNLSPSLIAGASTGIAVSHGDINPVGVVPNPVSTVGSTDNPSEENAEDKAENEPAEETEEETEETGAENIEENITPEQPTGNHPEGQVYPRPDEMELFYRCVQAEGYTLGIRGMRLIADVILNLSRKNGCSITETITAPGQFEVYTTGAIWKGEILPKTIEAVDMEIVGPELDYKVLFFRTLHFHSFGTPAYQVGNTFFSYE